MFFCFIFVFSEAFFYCFLVVSLKAPKEQFACLLLLLPFHLVSSIMISCLKKNRAECVFTFACDDFSTVLDVYERGAFVLPKNISAPKKNSFSRLCLFNIVVVSEKLKKFRSFIAFFGNSSLASEYACLNSYFGIIHQRYMAPCFRSFAPSRHCLFLVVKDSERKWRKTSGKEENIHSWKGCKDEPKDLRSDTLRTINSFSPVMEKYVASCCWQDWMPFA